jgi:hypothetical protein
MANRELVSGQVNGADQFSRRGFLGRLGQRTFILGAAVAGIIFRPRRSLAQRPPGHHPYDSQLGICSLSSGNTTTTTQNICMGLFGFRSWTPL